MDTTSGKEKIHWTVPAAPAPECQHLDGATGLDVLAVGGGLTGCRPAQSRVDDGTAVALVVGRGNGWGASGRSGGQGNPIRRQTAEKLIEMLGRGTPGPGQRYPHDAAAVAGRRTAGAVW